MMKEVSCKQMQLDSTTNLHPSSKAAWETVAYPHQFQDTTVQQSGNITYRIIMTAQQFEAI